MTRFNDDQSHDERGAAAMNTAGLPVELWNPARYGLTRLFLRRESGARCQHLRSVWRQIRRPDAGILVEGTRYCRKDCLEPVLTEVIGRVRSATPRPRMPHRVPLGLVLLSQGQITVEQLRTALAAQRAAGRGRIGDWMIRLGFVGEPELTAAVARQWSCPVLRSPLPPSNVRPFAAIPQLPSTLLSWFRMAPVDYVALSSTLHIAFAEQIDYTVLYAIEQITGCRTEPCIAVPGLIRHWLESLGPSRSETELVFDRDADGGFPPIVASYAARLGTTEIRLAACGAQLWVRLLLSRGSPLDLVLRSGPETPPGAGATAF